MGKGTKKKKVIINTEKGGKRASAKRKGKGSRKERAEDDEGPEEEEESVEQSWQKERKREERRETKKEWEPDRLLPLILYVGHIKEAIGRASMKSIEKGKAKTQNSPYCTQIYYFSFAYTVSLYVLGFIFTMCTGSSSTSRNSTAWSRSYCCWGPPDWRTFSVQQFRPSFRLRFLLLC